jgi:phosphoribosylformylglycinamidine synthase
MSGVELSARLKKYRLNADEYELIKRLLGREPRAIEWPLFSALWSEHCSYKSSKIHLRGLFSQSPRVVQSFGENAGVVDLGEGERVAFKIESHNHPSYIEPYQGAATGVGGILRDIFTMGARPIALANYLCFGEPKAERMTALVDGVVRGIAGYGNCVGVPTVTGQTEFHSSYNRNILVNAMAVGLFRPGESIHLSRAKGVGNRVVYVGAKTGRDGVHGASMASESFAEDSANKRPTVQIGDPFFEKLLIESCIEVMQAGLVVAIQDMGAAGLTSSSFEMASKGGVGLDLALDRVPLREAGLQPEEILLSESQERMLLVCEPSKVAEVERIFAKWGLDACEIGQVVEARRIRLTWHGEVLTEIDPDLLVENAPRYERTFSKWTFPRRVSRDLSGASDSLGLIAPNAPDPHSFSAEALGHIRGCSRDWIHSQYDNRVGAATARGCEDSVGVVKLKDSGRALGVVLGCRPAIMRADAHLGGFDSVVYPTLELALKGFEAVGLTDCLNFGNPERPEIMSEFVAALDGMNSACRRLGIPIVSGNVSFYNETSGANITSTPSTGVVGLRPSLDGLPLSHFGADADGGQVFYVRLGLARTWGHTAELKQPEKAAAVLGDWTGLEQLDELAELIQGLRSLGASRELAASRAVGKFGLAYALERMGGRACVSGLESCTERLFGADGAWGYHREDLYAAVLVLRHQNPTDEATLRRRLGSASSKRLAVIEIGRVDLAKASQGQRVVSNYDSAFAETLRLENA